MGTTTRKTKIIGTENYICESTGEMKEMQVISVEDRDFNFYKLWIEHILSAIDELGNQKMKIAFWIFDNLNKENQLILTQRQIAKETESSIVTVNATIKSLVKTDILRKINNGGAYQVNPNVIFKGGRGNRMNVLIEYQNLPVSEPE